VQYNLIAASAVFFILNRSSYLCEQIEQNRQIKVTPVFKLFYLATQKKDSMKKLMTCVICMFSAGVMAQDDFRFGIQGGVNLHGFTTGNGVDIDNTGLSIGGVAEYRINTVWALQSGVQFNQKGGIYDPPSVFDNEVADIKLAYLNVPILAKLRLVKQLHFVAGPQLGFLVSEKIEISGNEAEGNDTKSFDLELLGGLAYEFNNGLFLQGTYGMGTTKLYDNMPYKNSAINLSIGYFFK